MTFPGSEPVALSGLRHYLSRPRQCALLHLEQVLEETRLTAERRILHGRVEQSGAEAVTRRQ